MSSTPFKENPSYFVPAVRSCTSEKKHRKMMSATTYSNESPSHEINNNFEVHKNYTQKNFYTQDFYKSRSNLLNTIQKNFFINREFIELCNRIKLIEKKKKQSQQRCEQKTISIKEFLEQQKRKAQILNEKEQLRNEQEKQINERNKWIQTMNEENQKNYFMRRNHILQRNFNDADETRSKSLHHKQHREKKMREDLTQKTMIVNDIRSEEKKWSENKRKLWKKKMLENQRMYNDKIKQEEKIAQAKLKMMKKKEMDENSLRSSLQFTLCEEKSINEEYYKITSQDFTANQFLICKYSQNNVTPNLKHRKFAKVKY